MAPHTNSDRAKIEKAFIAQFSASYELLQAMLNAQGGTQRRVAGTAFADSLVRPPILTFAYYANLLASPLLLGSWFAWRSSRMGAGR